MSPNEIDVGKTYHNGKTGNRSYSARKVLKFNTHWSGMRYIDYLQVEGRYKGEENQLSLESFSRWAKGEVEDTNA